jgi:hypothetical protein
MSLQAVPEILAMLILMGNITDECGFIMVILCNCLGVYCSF